MARSLNRDDAPLSRIAIGAALDDWTGVRGLIRHSLARPVTAVFIALPLVSAAVGLGTPSLLLTLSGLAALYLAADLLMERTNHPISPDHALQLILVTWVFGLAILGAAAWAARGVDYHGELVTVAGVVFGAFIGAFTQRSTAVLWGVAAFAAIALGASLGGPFNVETFIAASSIAVGVLVGTVLGEILQRFVRTSRQE